MAYLSRSYLTEEPTQQAQQAGGSSSAAPPSAGGGSPGATSANAAGSAQPQTWSGAYPGITAYLSANKDQGSALASDVAGKVGSEVQGAQDSIAQQGQDWQKTNQSALDSWKASNDAGYQTYLGDSRAARASAADAAAGKPALVNQHRANSIDSGGPIYEYGPNTYTAEQQATWDKAYRNYSAMPYAAAPAPSPTDWHPDTSKVAQARTDLSALGTDQGREAYLQQGNTSPTYSNGMAGLDAALLGRGLNGVNLPAQYGDVLAALGAPAQPTAPVAPAAEYATETPPAHLTRAAPPLAPPDRDPGSVDETRRNRGGR